VDDRMIKMLWTKIHMAAVINGDNWREWLVENDGLPPSHMTCTWQKTKWLGVENGGQASAGA
jgi:hypothetical protein